MRRKENTPQELLPGLNPSRRLTVTVVHWLGNEEAAQTCAKKIGFRFMSLRQFVRELRFFRVSPRSVSVHCETFKRVSNEGDRGRAVNNNEGVGARPVATRV